MTNEELLEIIEKAARENQTQLELRECGITSLPPEIGKLKNLTRIYLNGNKIETLPPEIGELTNLTRLYLRDNKITCLPPEIGKLTLLTHIYIRGNKLSALPSEIGNLTELKGLFLSDNNISSLPRSINNLTKLSNLDLTRNPIDLPPDILNNVNEPNLIIQYYFKYQESETEAESLNEVKMLVLGPTGAGKTTLVKRLLNDEFSDTQPTRGIDLQTWPIEIDQQNVKVNVWDFGGSERMHFAHQFFFSKRSIYLVVADANKNQAENEIEYWLESIKNFGGNSPIIVVGNKVDQKQLSFDRGPLAQKYPNIKTFVGVSCQENYGIQELKTVITREIAALPHNIHRELDPTWSSVKSKLTQMQEPAIATSEYHSLARSEAMVEEGDRLELLKLLNDLGIVFYLGKDPRLEDNTIYQSQFLVNGIYTLLNDPELNQYQGVLEAEQFDRIFVNFPQVQATPFLITEAMCKMKLALEVDERQMYIIPDLLGTEAVVTDDNWQDADNFEYRYDITPPSSIISRFLIEMQKYIYENYYWRNGVILATENNKALVRFDRKSKKLSIWVNGQAQTRQEFLQKICDRFYLIHKTIPKLEFEEVMGGAGNYSELLEDLDRDKPEIPTVISVNEQEPTFILDEMDEIPEDLPSTPAPFDPNKVATGQASTLIIDEDDRQPPPAEQPRSPATEESSPNLTLEELETPKEQSTPDLTLEELVATPQEEFTPNLTLEELVATPAEESTLENRDNPSLNKTKLDSDLDESPAESQDKQPSEPISSPVIPPPPKLDFTPVEHDEDSTEAATSTNDAKKSGPNLILVSLAGVVVLGVAIGSYVYISQSINQPQEEQTLP